MIKKVISGGQTGADQGALFGAGNLPTGGYAPARFWTEDGPAPWLGTVYGLTETNGHYARRTRMNVQAADGTLVISPRVGSTGTRQTIRCCQELKKPYLVIDALDKLKDPGVLEEVERWIEDFDIRTLNVAGNRESVSPGVTKAVERFMRKLLT